MSAAVGNRPHRNQLGGGALRVGQIIFADLFANSDDNPLPADHRADAERYRDRHFDLGQDELCELSSDFL